MGLNHKGNGKEKEKSSIANTYRITNLEVGGKDDAAIHKLMKRYQSAKRVGSNRLMEKGKEGEKANEREQRIYEELRVKFPKLTGWDVNAAMVQAEGIIDSQRELLPGQVTYLESKIEKLGKKKNPKKELVKRIEELKADLAEIKGHIEAGTVPAAVFGGKGLWKKVTRKVPGAAEEWRAARSDQYFSQGETANKWGNRHFRLEMDGNHRLYLSVRVWYKENEEAEEILKWVKMEGEYSFGQLHAFMAFAGECKKTITLIRVSPGHYEARVTISEEVIGQELIWNAPAGEVFAGIDLNLDHLAIVLTDKQGQFREHHVFKYNNLGELPEGKSKPYIGELAKGIVAWLTEKKVDAVILEDLKINQTFTDSESFNRRTSPFSYNQVTAAITRRCLRHGISTKLVNPAYTSWIGDLKYSQMYGISRHVAAAYVIARRGLNLKELLPKQIIKAIPVIQASIPIPPPPLRKSKKRDKARQDALTLIHRLSNWNSSSPKAGKPWLLWASLLSVSKSAPDLPPKK